jgi:hypothetical protein
MAITICKTRAEINAIVGVKQIWHDVPQARWVVRTGTDIEIQSYDSLILNRVQFLNGALITGGQTLLDAVKGYIADRLTNGTPAQKIYWGSANEFLRAHRYVNQLRVGIIGAKTNPQSIAEMDSIFLNGATYSPPVA